MEKTIKLTLLWVMMCFGYSLSAQINYMHVETNGGQTPYLLDDVQVVTFSQTDMNVLMLNGDQTPHVLNDITKIVFDNTVQVNEVLSNVGVNVFPNPTTGMVYINIKNGEVGDYVLNVYNVLGALVYSMNANSSTGMLNENIDFSEFTKGIYMINIECGTEIITRKIIVQ
jgi:hypothetical protein